MQYLLTAGKQELNIHAACGTSMHKDIMEESKSNNQFENQALTDHLRELRSCLIVSFTAIFIGFCISYAFIRPVGSWFFKPLVEVLPQGTSLIFTSYQEGFFFI